MRKAAGIIPIFESKSVLRRNALIGAQAISSASPTPGIRKLLSLRRSIPIQATSFAQVDKGSCGIDGAAGLLIGINDIFSDK